jgi:hypothetical protein
MGERRNSYRILVGKLKGSYHFENTHRWKGNIKMDHKEIGWVDMD